MSSVSSSGSRSSSSTPSTSSSQKSSPTTKSSSSQRASSDSTRSTSSQSRTQDTSNITREKEKAGATPDFSQSFGALGGQAPAAASSQAPLSGTFRQGMKGDEVKQLQEALNAKGARLEVDGKFGKDTLAAVRQFQEQQGLQVDGIAGKDTLGRLQGGGQTPPSEARPGETKPGEAQPSETQPGATQPGGALNLPQGYESLEKLSGELARRDPRFNTDTASGRAATALALAIGGTEVYGKGTTGTDFFTRRGGTGNNMLGFAQFNQKYHAGKTNTPEKYTKFLGDILTGQSRMPNSRRGGNHVEALTQAIEAGKIRTGQDLRNFMTQRGFGGSNWQGIDDGWGRNPGLANALAGFLNGGQ